MAPWYAQYSISFCSVCQLLNKYTAIRYMLRLRIADIESGYPYGSKVSAHREHVAMECPIKLFNEYFAIAKKLGK